MIFNLKKLINFGLCLNSRHYIKDKQSLCAEGREYTSILCSKCIDSYSESLYSSKCVDCNGTGINFLYLVLPTIFGLFISVVLILINIEKMKKQKDKSRQEMPSKIMQVLRSNYYQLMIKIMIFKCILYYQQGISQLLLSIQLMLQ